MGRVYARHVLRFIFIVALLGTWFMPLIIAALYKLPHQGQIAVLSLALGWTGAGWLAALVIAMGGAIRATRPALAGQALPEGMPAAGAYAGAMPKAPPQSAWPGAAATAPERTQSPQWAQPPERTQSPQWAQPPERTQSPQWAPSPEHAESPQWAQPPEPSQRTQPPEPTQGPPPPSWPDNPR
jgi:Superinfection immunity protein